MTGGGHHSVGFPGGRQEQALSDIIPVFNFNHHNIFGRYE